MNSEVYDTTAPSECLKESCLRNIPMWVIDWYRLHNINTEYVSLVKNTTLIHTKDEIDVATILIEDLLKDKMLVNNKRLAPKAKKICSICGDITLVNSAKQFCKQANCKGKLKLILKVKKEVKRKPPKCKKKCKTCNEIFDCVATALQKCKKCGEKLYILK
tara:strand:- start:1312 stop:1794 length:483 start_codon:yes stop_codon:yes gene_type:complete